MWHFILMCSLVAVADDAKGDAVKAELKKLEGAWKIEKLEYAGKDITEKYKFDFVIKDDVISIEGNDAVKKEYAKLAMKLDPATTPRIMDFKVAGGIQIDAKIEGIYELKGDDLKICARVLGDGRPAEFASPDGQSVAYLVLKREKK